ncbi:hypothetical protein VTK26DRAFT_210 [Humicola hyalothermophila]
MSAQRPGVFGLCLSLSLEHKGWIHCLVLHSGGDETTREQYSILMGYSDPPTCYAYLKRQDLLSYGRTEMGGLDQRKDTVALATVTRSFRILKQKQTCR